MAEVHQKNTNDAHMFRDAVFLAICPKAPPDDSPVEEMKEFRVSLLSLPFSLWCWLFGGIKRRDIERGQQIFDRPIFFLSLSVCPCSIGPDYLG